MHKLIISHLTEEVWKTHFGIVDVIGVGMYGIQPLSSTV